MKKILLIASLLLGAAFYAAAQRSPESVLGQALHQEEIEGDLKGAIATYQKVVAMKGVSHKTAAEALLHLGRCYERLGDNDARKVYERIEHEYADQTEAVTMARARLASSRPAAGSGIALTRVMSTAASNGGVSPDGRFLSFKTSDALMLRDLSSGENRVLVKASDRFIGKSLFSPDGKRVAYVAQNANGPWQLNVININGTDDQTIYRTSEYFMPEGWSPSGEILVVASYAEPNRPRIPVRMAWVSAANGKERALLVPHRIYGWPVALSPDGRSIAYTGAKEGLDKGTIYVLSADGSHEFPVVESRWQDQVLSWTEDAKGVLFSSDRTGSIGIWLAQIGNGGPKGTPVMVQDSIVKSGNAVANQGTFFYLNAVVPIGMTNKGAFFYDVGGTSNQMYYVDLDRSTGRVSGEPTPVGPSNDLVNVLPAWSPDSRQLTYHSILGTVQGENSRRLLHIYSPETHVQHDLSPEMEYLGSKVAWFGDSRSLLAWGLSAEGQHGLYKVDTSTGKAPRCLCRWRTAPPILRSPRMTRLSTTPNRQMAGGRVLALLPEASKPASRILSMKRRRQVSGRSNSLPTTAASRSAPSVTESRPLW